MPCPINISFPLPPSPHPQNNSIKLAAHIYHPAPNSPDCSGIAIIICQLWISIKEQSLTNYARPRSLEDPVQRVEEIKSAVIYLTSRRDVKPEKVGVLGICASGGYAPRSSNDLPIKAIATSAAACVGTMARRGFNKDSSSMEILNTQLEAAARDRASDGTGEKVPIDLMANFDTFAYNGMIGPRPLLMITGTRAVTTMWYSEDGVVKAKEPKELLVIEGPTHADLYDHVDEAGAKLVEFFGKSLA
ncbi:hypothetical protein K469DRAFT_734736 [Zopfia rhizophila CBS 207.26]|uniref:Alpha/beta-hydrolase n=1 Tax=Zopfia rhizophila CBS 207.26 TaxID=1314779 RepID=A0A6A6EU29_9PEZI|nr:hypothetical protein K469DRAFT_734736 [Zopfia rhizophila CBS 207.26]